jgi:hypothetical protein
MGSVNIASDDKTNVKDFDEGNSVTVRVVVAEQEKKDYEKGKTVTVHYGEQQASGKIVSEPIVIDEKKEKGKNTLSLVVEKAT